MRRTLQPDMRKAWAFFRADRSGQRLTDTSTWTMLSGVRNEDGRPGGFLHVTGYSSRHCLTHRRIAFGDGASCWCLRRNPRWVSVIDAVRINRYTAQRARAHTHTHTFSYRINSSTAHSHSLTHQRSMLTKSEGHCLCSNTCTPRYPRGEARN